MCIRPDWVRFCSLKRRSFPSLTILGKQPILIDEARKVLSWRCGVQLAQIFGIRVRLLPNPDNLCYSCNQMKKLKLCLPPNNEMQ